MTTTIRPTRAEVEQALLDVLKSGGGSLACVAYKAVGCTDARCREIAEIYRQLRTYREAKQ